MEFNTPQSHTIFIPLRRMGYVPAIVGQRTTMKMNCTTTCLASEYDNIFYDSKLVEVLDSGIILFYESFPDMKVARRISDHVPVWVELDLRRRTWLVSRSKGSCFCPTSFSLPNAVLPGFSLLDPQWENLSFVGGNSIPPPFLFGFLALAPKFVA